MKIIKSPESWWQTSNLSAACKSCSCRVAFQTDSGFDHGTSFGQWDISECVARKGLISTYILGLYFWNTLLIFSILTLILECVRGFQIPTIWRFYSIVTIIQSKMNYIKFWIIWENKHSLSIRRQRFLEHTGAMILGKLFSITFSCSIFFIAPITVWKYLVYLVIPLLSLPHTGM